MSLYNNRPQIKIGDKWSYDTWGAMLAAGWSLDDAPVKEQYVEIPSADGALDITEVLAGEPRYGNRNLAFGLVLTQPEPEWETIRQTIANYASGQRMKITLPHDTKHYLHGRIKLGNLERQAGSAVISIEANCDPWRYKNSPTTVTLTVPGSGTLTGTLRNERRRVLPEITADAAVDVTINEITQSISAGTFTFTDFILHPGNNPVTIAGDPGTKVTLTYQEGSL